MYSYHIHSTFSDGKNAPEEIVLAAIEKGFVSIGFSDHGYTNYDLRYCMKDQTGYINEIKNLKEKYKNQIQIYLGVEEDAFHPLNRNDFDYIIGSCHYGFCNNNYYPIDSNYDYFKKCLEAFGNDHLAFAESYYSNFCEYITNRKPDIIGHFDLLTKYDERNTFALRDNAEYNKIAEKYLKIALKSDCFFEVNTGAISRNCRTLPYPDEKLLHVLKKENGKLIINSDTHEINSVDCYFAETRKLLKDIGFQYVYTLYNNEFIKDML